MAPEKKNICKIGISEKYCPNFIASLRDLDLEKINLALDSNERSIKLNVKGRKKQFKSWGARFKRHDHLDFSKYF